MVVYLIGAGPGNPELITLKAVKALNKADVVIYDRLANEKILEHAGEAKLIYVGKKAGEHYKSQDEINQIIINEAKDTSNNIIVRLKGGDPFVFGRGGEEILSLISEGIKFEVIPGVTSAIGVPTSLGLPVTHRGVATSFTVVTGHEDPTKNRKQVKWDYTADTIIVLMGIGKMKENTSEIMKYRDSKTPVCVIENGTLPNEKTIFGTLGDIGDKDINTPAILIVGNVIDVFKEIKGIK
ncbi:uroporphyrinogen-III C-methyltransferase [Methanobrevibacter cuticularis]|uniref:uroporphyrinogen-III C-methyltransferase n=1 Tax=Methanobrevibacter cuticularis TaxID=47311 RepID=A0A166DY47_9EURY|nr:uroporphyrinogen-III C-methyltransferase [Methanobrevibacter cuticularis]KZX16075.1 uroporphyrinogen-III C-methyltransferase [Methanobrevibacter cuticularis]